MAFKQWTDHSSKPSPVIREKLLKIGTSIWYSSSHKSHYDKGENGITEYSTTTDSIMNTIPYPDNITPFRQCCCEYNQIIYIIDGEHEEIISFNPSTKHYTKKITIPIKLGMYPSAVSIFDKIHIFDGADNDKKHLIYNITKNTIKVLEDKGATDTKMIGVCLMKYGNKILRFGGFGGWSNVDTFMISSEIKEDDDENGLEWDIKEEFKCKQPVTKCGPIVYGKYLILFGGDADVYIDTIYLLDLEGDVGWIELKHLKCPIPSAYLAVLTDDNFVHLFTEINEWPEWQESERGHYSIPISTVLGSKFIPQK